MGLRIISELDFVYRRFWNLLCGFLIKIFIVITLLTFSPFRIFAQYVPISYDAPYHMNIIQMDNREFSTLLFFDYTVPEDTTWKSGPKWINFGEKTYISIPGSNKKYNMLSTVNMPIDSEAEHKMMLFDRAGQRHKFVLEFEKIPDSCFTFDIIEDINDSNAFNIRNINFNSADSVEFVDIDDYIADCPLKEYGQYYVNGTVISYIKYKGIIVNTVANFLNQYGKYVCVNISVQNFRDRSILFNPANLSAIGYRYPKLKGKKSSSNSNVYEDDIYAEHSVRRTKDTEQYDESNAIHFDVELLTYEEYDRIVRKKQQWESFWAALGEGLAAASAGYSSSTTTYSGNAYTTANAHASGNIGNVYGYVNAYGASYTTAYGQSHTSSYNGLAQYAANQQARANMANLSYSQGQIRQQIGDGYVKLHTIPAETEYSGFFNVKYTKKMQGIIYTIIIDGEPFTFYL